MNVLNLARDDLLYALFMFSYRVLMVSLETVNVDDVQTTYGSNNVCLFCS